MSDDYHSDRPQDGIIVDADFVDTGPADANSLDAGSTRPASMALVRMVEPAQWSHVRPLPRPDSIFLSHLIATHDHAPQTCSLRRASASDANAAYTANRQRIGGAGLRARQIV
jgi:hypothetical protein